MLSKPSKSPIGYASVRVFAHATEDHERVLAAVRNTLTLEVSQNAIFKTINLTGHHGNPIKLIELELCDRQKLMFVLGSIGSKLSSLDKETLRNEMPLHLEKGNLYLRFDKQQAFSNKLKFSSNDPIHFKFHFRNKTADQIIAICKEAGLIP